jgi:hypothetical protein
VTDDKASIWDTITFGFIVKWIKKYPIGGKPMVLADLPGDHRDLMTPYRQKFQQAWENAGGKTSGAMLRRMTPWWIFTHAIQAPRKYAARAANSRRGFWGSHRPCTGPLGNPSRTLWILSI